MRAAQLELVHKVSLTVPVLKRMGLPGGPSLIYPVFQEWLDRIVKSPRMAQMMVIPMTALLFVEESLG